MQYEEFRKAGHYLVDYIAAYLQNVEDKPLFLMQRCVLHAYGYETKNKTKGN